MPPAAPDTAFNLAPLEPSALVSAQSQVRAAESNEDVQSYVLALRKAAEPPPDLELAAYERFALLGVSAGFMERNLSPHLPEHIAIVPPLLEEIRGVYRELRRLGTPYDSQEFKLRAFHYGVHKASYLDWQLYLSKECY
jgi:hypothetical protein